MKVLDVGRVVDRGTIKVGIVDDHALLAQVLAHGLEAVGFQTRVLQPSAEPEVIAFARELEADVLLLDLHLGAVGSSIEMIPRLRALGCKVVVVTGEPSPVQWGACIEAGAHAVLSKATSFDELVDHISAILDDEVANRGENEDLLVQLRRHREEERRRVECFERLTAREREVLHDLAQGMPAEVIAATRFVAVSTVRSHIRSILQKLGVNSQLAAVALAARSGWLEQ
jgi:DNA-binding NarL/FixJ family response regulator